MLFVCQDLLKKTHQCAEIIRVAKDRQESEANKAANILLEELEMEKNREESKRAAAARKREKKKRKKAEKKGKVGDEEEEEEEAKEEREEEEEEVGVVVSRLVQEETKERTPEIIEEVRGELFFT
jgi:ankyrin repeat domain-containing protein 17